MTSFLQESVVNVFYSTLCTTGDLGALLGKRAKSATETSALFTGSFKLCSNEGNTEQHSSSHQSNVESTLETKQSNLFGNKGRNKNNINNNKMLKDNIGFSLEA